MKKQINVIDILGCSAGVNVQQEAETLVRQAQKPTEQEHQKREKEVEAAFETDKDTSKYGQYY